MNRSKIAFSVFLLAQTRRASSKIAGLVRWKPALGTRHGRLRRQALRSAFEKGMWCLQTPVGWRPSKPRHASHFDKSQQLCELFRCCTGDGRSFGTSRRLQAVGSKTTKRGLCLKVPVFVEFRAQKAVRCCICQVPSP